MHVSKERFETAQYIEFSLWENTSVNLRKVLRELIDSLDLQEFLENSELSFNRVLEIGIGPLGIGWSGLFTEKFVIGIDPLNRIKIETEKEIFNTFLSNIQQRTNYCRALGEKLPFRGNSFDFVVCDNVLDHTQRPVYILKEISRVMSNGGVFILGVNCFSLAGIIKWRYYSAKKSPKPRNILAHPHSYLEKTLMRQVKKAGFNIYQKKQASFFRRIVGHQYRLYLMATK